VCVGVNAGTGFIVDPIEAQLDVDLGTVYCAKALAATCKLRMVTD